VRAIILLSIFLTLNRFLQFDFWKELGAADLAAEIAVPPEKTKEFESTMQNNGIVSKIKINNINW